MPTDASMQVLDLWEFLQKIGGDKWSVFVRTVSFRSTKKPGTLMGPWLLLSYFFPRYGATTLAVASAEPTLILNSTVVPDAGIGLKAIVTKF